MRIPRAAMRPGAVYHVTQRGVGKTAIFLDPTDRRAFLWCLGRSALRWRWEVLAYCLMGNHVHLVVRDREANLDRGIGTLFAAYSLRFNARHGRVGHLYQGRYRAFCVEDEAYLTNVVRYVLLNPVKAGIVADPGEWEWSSFAATAGLRPAPAWLAAGAVLGMFHGDREWFGQFVRNGATEPPLRWERIGRPV